MKKTPKPTDVNRLAFEIMSEATEDQPKHEAEEEEDRPKEKNPAAVALGRLGGLKGGHARAKKLSAKKRKEIARKAVEARWAKKT